MPKRKTNRQVRYLLSKASPLTAKEKARLKRELRSGKVTVRKSASPKRKPGRSRPKTKRRRP